MCWLEATSGPKGQVTPIKVVFTRESVDKMSEYSFLALHDVSLHPPSWDMNFDALIFYLLEESWIWLVLKWPELAELRYRPPSQIRQH